MKPKREESTTTRTFALIAAAVIALGTPALAGSYKKDIIDTAAASTDFGTLLAAAEAAGLVETLKGDGPFTVFAPTGEAFKKIPEETLANLLRPENKDQLVELLTYHVIAGDITFSDLVDDETVATVEGASVTIDLDNGAMVNDAMIVQADVTASNGVIHAIDTVLMPPAS